MDLPLTMRAYSSMFEKRGTPSINAAMKAAPPTTERSPARCNSSCNVIGSIARPVSIRSSILS
jgi:hypothetical protein